MSGGDHRLEAVEIDDASLASASRDAEHERQVAIADLLDDNLFRPEDASGGPYRLKVSLLDGRLALDVAGEAFEQRHVLSLSPLKGLIRDYFLICESYAEAIRDASPTRIEAIDMGRRGLHNEAAEKLRERLAGKVEVDLDTARRLFTLVCALHRRP
jgi:uncharacterized protein (UPF0262 family)